MIANFLGKCYLSGPDNLANCMIENGYSLTNDFAILQKLANRICRSSSVYFSKLNNHDFCRDTKEFKFWVSQFENNPEISRWQKNGLDNHAKAVEFVECSEWYSDTKTSWATQFLSCLRDKKYIFIGDVGPYFIGPRNVHFILQGDEPKCFSFWFYSQYKEFCNSPLNKSRPMGGFEKYLFH